QNPDATYYETFVAELWKRPKRKSHNNEMFNRHLERHAAALSFGDPKPLHVKKVRRRIILIRMLAAAIVVVAAVGYLLFKASNSNDSVEFVAAKGVKKQINLPDGTRVWLNSDSKLSYSANFEKEKNRAVHL